MLSRTPVPLKFDLNWVLFQSAWPWLKIDNLSIPTESLLQEAIAHKKNFEPYVDNLSKGWSVLKLAGPLELWDSEIVDHSPKVHHFNSILKDNSDLKSLITNFEFAEITAAQILLLEPGGSVSWHSDKQLKRLDRLVLPLNNPKGCSVEFAEWGQVPYESGLLYLIDTSWRHRAINSGNEDRYHLQLTFKAPSISEKFKKIILESSVQQND